RQRPGRVQWLTLTDVVEVDAGRLAVVQTPFEGARLVVDGEEHGPHAGRGEGADDPFDDRAAADAEQWLRDLVGERPEPLAPAAGHDDGDRSRHDTLELVARADGHQPAALHDGDGAHPV